MLPEDLEAGCSHEDNYVCSAADYREHMAEVFALWQDRPEVKRGEWPQTLEECWGMKPRVSYPLSKEDAHVLADIFIREYAPSRNEKNRLDQFEGFIYEGPEYLTMFAPTAWPSSAAKSSCTRPWVVAGAIRGATPHKVDRA